MTQSCISHNGQGTSHVRDEKNTNAVIAPLRGRDHNSMIALRTNSSTPRPKFQASIEHDTDVSSCSTLPSCWAGVQLPAVPPPSCQRDEMNSRKGSAEVPTCYRVHNAAAKNGRPLASRYATMRRSRTYPRIWEKHSPTTPSLEPQGGLSFQEWGPMTVGTRVAQLLSN